MTPEPQQPTDEAVVQAVLAGRSELFRLLVRRHQDRMYRHALRMLGSPDDAADVVQRAFVTGYRKLATCQAPDRVGAWLFRIGSNLCKDDLKDLRRKVVPLDHPDVRSMADPEQEARLEGGEIRGRIQDALGRLPADLREAFVLKHLEGHSYDEMTAQLDVSVSALKMRVKRAREQLQRTLRVCL